jgi:hypothetical protein
MNSGGRVVGGILLIALGVYFLRRAARVEQLRGVSDDVPPLAAAFGISRRRWLWELRIGNAVTGTASIAAAIFLFATA